MKGVTPAPSTRSNRGVTSVPAVAGGDVIVSTGEGDGLADWATVVISFAALCVTAFAAWYGYKAYQRSRQADLSTSQ